MAARTQVSVEEYLRTSYDPDCDYVDGEIVERNLGELDHSDLQSEIIAYFRAHKQRLQAYAFAEQRVQISPTRYRVPDICVIVGEKPREQIFRQPPFIAIEILSKDDRVEQMQIRINDYLTFGIRYVWVINPRTRIARIYTKDGAHKAKDGMLRTENPAIELPLPEIFKGLE
jgi:Uma2 family endonuclease